MTFHSWRFALPALCLSLAACATSVSSESLGALPPDSRWALQDSSLADLKGPAGQAVRLQVNAQGIAGDSGCNRYSAPVTWSGAELRISHPVSTKRACVDEARNRAERALYGAFPAVRAARMEDGRLRLELEDGGFLLFATDMAASE